jgi:hypothetical protein
VFRCVPLPHPHSRIPRHHALSCFSLLPFFARFQKEFIELHPDLWAEDTGMEAGSGGGAPPPRPLAAEPAPALPAPAAPAQYALAAAEPEPEPEQAAPAAEEEAAPAFDLAPPAGNDDAGDAPAGSEQYGFAPPPPASAEGEAPPGDEPQ